MIDTYDVVVIGAGPGGYVAAIRAAQLSLRVCLVEKEPSLGGCCLNVGCIPSKALLESSEHFHIAKHRFEEHGIKVGKVEVDLPMMMRRKENVVKELTQGIANLMERSKVAVLQGRASISHKERVEVIEEGGQRREINAKAIILATGSAPIELPFLPFDGQRVVDSTGALSFETVPEHLVVIGAGAVGLELGSVWSRLGARVTIVEMMPQIVPSADAQMAKNLQRSLKQQGLEIRLNTKLTAAQTSTSESLTLTLEDKKSQTDQLVCDRVLVAVGRRPYSEGLGLAEVGIEIDDGGRVVVDQKLRTSVPSIYAIGDLVKGPMLAHKAEEEGIAAAEIIAGKGGSISHEVIPSVVYTHPELAWVGLTEADAKDKGIKYKLGRFLFRANGRAKSMGEEEGMVKIIAEAKTDRLLGVHIVGPQASELLPEAALGLEFRASAEDIARTCHAHPTLSEAIKEAAMAVDRRSIHA